MTFAELRERLKHIAVLCIGLSIDLANEIQIRDNLTAENKQLKRDLQEEKATPKRRTMTPEQAERHRQAMRDYYARKREQNTP
jgi:hypothetical protein